MIGWWLFIASSKLGKPKGAKDTYKRIRGVDKRRKDPEAYKAIKKYVAIEKEYEKLKTFRDTLNHGTVKRKYVISRMKNCRIRQALLYEIIAENYLLNKLAKELGVGRTMPYRRYISVMKEGTKWKHK